MERKPKEAATTVLHTVRRRAPSSSSAGDSDASFNFDGGLQQKLLNAVSNSQRKSDAVESILGSLQQAISPASVVYIDRDENQMLRVPNDTQLFERLPPGAADRLIRWANETCQSGAVAFYRLAGAYQWRLVMVPVISRSGPPDIMCAVFREGESSDTRVAGVLQLGASHITLWSILQENNLAKTESKNTAAILELLSSLDNSADIKTACYLLVNDLRDFLGCGRIALGLKRTNRVDCRLAAVSGLSDFDKRSEVTRRIEAALNEAVLKEDVCVVTDAGGETTVGLLSHQRLLESGNARTLVSAPLYRDGGEVVGAWVFFSTESLPADGELVRFVRASRQFVGSRLWMLRRAQVHPLMRPFRALVDRKVRLKSAVGLLCAMVLAAVMLIPMNYRIGCQCQLEPVSRRFVAAPYDGTLEESVVKAGEIVSAGQVLAKMDARELRWEFTGLQADYNSEKKKRDAASARDEVAEAQQANLEMQRLNLKMQLLQHRLDNLDVKSPIEGIVIAGDLKRSEGAPLTTGQTMFEIGPLDKMIVEVAIPEREILYVQPGMQTDVRLDANPGETVTGKIVRVSPRPETRENESVYIAEVYLDNSGGLYRPGMKGMARVISEPHALGWNLFHKAWESFSMLIGC